MFSSIFGFYQLPVNSTLSPSPRLWQHKISPDITKCPLERQNWLQLRTTKLEGFQEDDKDCNRRLWAMLQEEGAIWAESKRTTGITGEVKEMYKCMYSERICTVQAAQWWVCMRERREWISSNCRSQLSTITSEKRELQMPSNYHKLSHKWFHHPTGHC